MKTGNITRLAKPIQKDNFELNAGDVFKHPALGEMVYERHKSSKGMVAHTVAGNKPYRIGTNFDQKWEVVGTAEILKDASDYNLLRKSPKGTLFVIQNRKSAELFRLIGFKASGKIEAENPLDGGKFSIDQSYTIKLISNIK